MNDIQLSPHFRLSEFTRSATASKYGINNTLDPNNPLHAEIINNLRKLCVNVLEPLRQHFFDDLPPTQGEKKGVFIGSGYRSTQLNKAVGGVAHSMHLTGHAVDIHIPDNATGRKWMEWIIDNCEFYKIIWETADKKHFWIHVSYSRKHNRQYVISNMRKK